MMNKRFKRNDKVKILSNSYLGVVERDKLRNDEYYYRVKGLTTDLYLGWFTGKELEPFYDDVQEGERIEPSSPSETGKPIGIHEDKIKFLDYVYIKPLNKYGVYTRGKYVIEDPLTFTFIGNFQRNELRRVEFIELPEGIKDEISKSMVNAEKKHMKPSDMQVGGDHYKKFKIQPFKFIMENNLNFAQGNIIKYVCRYDHKNGVEDLKKARHYIDLLIEYLERHSNGQT